MVDHLDRESRSENMRRVKGKDTGPELTVRRALHGLGRRFRLHRKDLPGSPDIVLPKDRLAIFVHGCFWHKHDCRAGNKVPVQNADYWSGKRERNVARDRRASDLLVALGWRVLLVWECQTKDLDSLRARLDAFLRGESPDAHDNGVNP